MLHFLDRYAGIPAVAILGHMRRKRALPPAIQNLGLLRTAAIGDTVLLSAVIADLRVAFPDASLTLFAGPTNLEVAQMLDGVDRIVEVPIVNVVTAVQRVRSIPIDVLLDFGQWPRFDALLACLSNASFTVGFKAEGQHRHYGYDATVEHSADVHEIENFRRLVRVLGIPTHYPPRLTPPSLRGPGAADYAVFHLWPGGRRKERKRWPEQNWRALVEEIAGRQMRVVLTGAPANRDGNLALVECLPQDVRSFVRSAAGVSLQETAEILAHARLVVSVDTGVMHMAAALGAPLVALHGPTSSHRWGPLGENAIAIDSPVSGSGYLHLGWEDASRAPACMESISYESVRDACHRVMERASRTQRSPVTVS